MVRSSTLELLQKYQDSETAQRVLASAANYLHDRYKVGSVVDWEAVDLLDHLRVVVRLDAKRMINTIGEHLNRGAE